MDAKKMSQRFDVCGRNEEELKQRIANFERALCVRGGTIFAIAHVVKDPRSPQASVYYEDPTAIPWTPRV